MTAPRTHTRQFCARCNAIDRVGFLVSKGVWEAVAGPRWEQERLCLACFAEIGDEKGIRWDADDDLEFYPMSYKTLADRRSWIENGLRVDDPQPWRRQP